MSRLSSTSWFSIETSKMRRPTAWPPLHVSAKCSFTVYVPFGTVKPYANSGAVPGSQRSVRYSAGSEVPAIAFATFTTPPVLKPVSAAHTWFAVSVYCGPPEFTRITVAGAAGVVTEIWFDWPDSFAGAALSNAATRYVYVVLGATPLSVYVVPAAVAIDAPLRKREAREGAAAVVRRSGPAQRGLARVRRRTGQVLRHVRRLGVHRRRRSATDAQDLDRADLRIVRTTVREIDVQLTIGDRRLEGLHQRRVTARLGKDVQVVEHQLVLDRDVEDAAADGLTAVPGFGKVQPHAVGAVRHREGVSELGP